MEDRVREIFKNNNISIKCIKQLNENVYEVITDEDKTLIVKLIKEKEKIAWEYKCLLNLKGKVRVPKIYMSNDEYISECIVIEKPGGNFIESYEDKENMAEAIGIMLASIHIIELNEQRGEEELRKIWNKYILNRTLYIGTAITEIFSKEMCDKVLNYITESMKLYSDPFELSMIMGKIDKEDIIANVKENNVTFINFEDAMIGDAAFDFARVYQFFELNEKLIEKFTNGYESIISVPEQTEDKMGLFLVIGYIEKIITYKNDESKKEKVNKYVEIINSIIDGTVRLSVD